MTEASSPFKLESTFTKDRTPPPGTMPPSFSDLQIDPPTGPEPTDRDILHALQTSSGKRVRLVPLCPADAPEAGTLRQDIERLTLVRNRHVLAVLGADVRYGHLYGVTEDMEGENLEVQLRQGHRFTTEEILHIAGGMGHALRAAARRGFIHRNLRPSSVLLGRGGVVKVGDFGPLSALGTFTGNFPPLPLTVAYLSPEQARGRPIDARSNIYSMGVTLYELSAGRPPFDGFDSSTSLLYQLSHVDPVGPRQSGASIPRELERVILRCLEKSPLDRFPDASKVVEALQGVRDSMESDAQAAITKEDDTGDFDIYEDQPLGEGGMGTLVRGRQRSLDRIVAIKIIREAFNTHPQFLQRFRREAELLAQVDNPNVVQVIGTGVWHGRLFYAMELVKGEDLCVRQLRGHRFSPEEVLHIAEGVTRALRAAWRYKIVHRDIKPSNIMLTLEGTVKVADFGLAKSLRFPGKDSHVVAGTPEYLSPEQGLGKPVDIRADIYSLGVVLYELVSGRHPFNGTRSSVAMIYQHLHTPPPALDGLGSAHPAQLRELIHRCLAKKPEDRYPDPEALLEAIQSARGMRGKPLPSQARPAATSPPRGRRLTPWVLGGLVLAAALAGGWGFTRTPLDPAPGDAGRSAYDLALGLGDYEGALRLAQAHYGPASSKAEEAAHRLRLHPFVKKEADALARVAERDWDAARTTYQELRTLAAPDRDASIQAAIAFCSSMAEAASLAKRSDWAGALRIYTRLAQNPSPEAANLEERIREAHRGIQGVQR